MVVIGRISFKGLVSFYFFFFSSFLINNEKLYGEREGKCFISTNKKEPRTKEMRIHYKM
jgi:hypothetical protein